jgi:hypothetical protein
MLLVKSELFSELNTIAGVRGALQGAIKLEHSTIPAYLYALYSLKPGENQRIADLLTSIVQEEMLHMSLACNVLNAIGGEPIPFDESAVWPVLDNPKETSYPAKSKARHACDTFNYTYTSLLKALNITFNGQPDNLGTAIGLMESLRQQAIDMMSGIVLETGPNQGRNAGPSFEYQPTNP